VNVSIYIGAFTVSYNLISLSQSIKRFNQNVQHQVAKCHPVIIQRKSGIQMQKES